MRRRDRWWLIGWTLLAVAGCEGGPPPAAPDWMGDLDPPPEATDGGVVDHCTRPSTGCACDEGTAPVDCYAAPIDEDDGTRTCHGGARYCRDGVWSACEWVRTFTIGSSATALITGPSACNACDPRCFISRDIPGPADLIPGRSSNVSYDPARGGIGLTPLPPMPESLPDSDGDGVPDVADECVGAGAFRAADGTCYGSRFLYHTLPYGASAIDPLDIRTQVRTADIYFLVDTTGSMGDELDRLQRDLTTGNFHPTIGSCGNGIMGAIRCTIPDAWFGVGGFDDFPTDPYGWAPYGDRVYYNLRDIQASLTSVQAGVNALDIHYGYDNPESNTQALWATATGGSLSSLPARTGCGTGRWGYPCFRDGTIPIVIHITDAPFHEGPGNAYGYSASRVPNHVTWATATSALAARSVRVITVQSCGGQSWCSEGLPHARSLAYATGSVDGSGNPYVFPISANGSGLTGAVVNAVVALANYERMDVTARAVGDTAGFTEAITTNGWGPRGSCTGTTSTTFVQCLPGSDVNFRVTFHNDVVMPTMVTQVFSFFIEIVGNGAYVLERVPVRIVVPALVAGYPATGSYQREYDSTLRCAANESPDWGQLSWVAATPTGTSIVFELRAARTLAGLATAPVASVTVPSATSPTDLTTALRAAGYADGLPFLRVTAVLRANSARTATPTLTSMDVIYRCIPSM